MSTSRSSPKKTGPRRQLLGKSGEDAAAAWYAARGWREVARNWRCREGEIDLVVARRRVLAFVEVKSRTSSRVGTAAEAVTLVKQTRLRTLALRFLADHPKLARGATLRFDVAAVTPTADAPIVEVIEAAF